MTGRSDDASRHGASANVRAATAAADPSVAIGIDGAGLWILATALGGKRQAAAPSTGATPDADRPPQPCAGAGSTSPRSYEAYIRSDAWRRSPARLAELRASGGRCRLCSRGAPETTVEVHHNTYERLGRERASDLCTLCRVCHRAVTAELRSRRYAAVELPELRDTPRMLIRGDARE